MKIDLNRLPEYVSENDMARFDDKLSHFGSASGSDKELEDRILSSVMRKAGFEMKETMTVKKTRRHGKRFVGFILAAALLGAGAVGAAAYTYYNGIWTAMKENFRGVEDEQEAMEKLKSVTNNFEGEVIENTFEGLDFTYEGVVSDSNEAHIIITIRKSDGEPFTLSDDGVIEIPFTRESEKITDGTFDKELFPDTLGYQIYSVNPDGSITADIEIQNVADIYKNDLYFSRNPKETISGEYVVSFSNIYVYPDWESYNKKAMDEELWDLDPAVINNYNNGDIKGYEEARDKRFEKMAQYSSEHYDGTLTFTVNTDDNSLHSQTVEGDTTVEVSVSNISLSAKITNENGYDIYEKTDNENETSERNIPIDIYFKDGTVLGDSESECYRWVSGNKVEFGSEDTQLPTAVQVTRGFSVPIDCNEVDYVIVDGHKVEF